MVGARTLTLTLTLALTLPLPLTPTLTLALTLTLTRWARERTALGWAHGRGEAGGLWENISASSCALAGVPRPRPARLLWWADAPVYERSDWSDFYGRVRANWARLSWYTFDHEAYLCYKVRLLLTTYFVLLTTCLFASSEGRAVHSLHTTTT